MSDTVSATSISSLRDRLDSFDNAYLIAVRMRSAGHRPVFIVRTDEPLQPIRVTASLRDHPVQLLMVLQ